MLQACSERASGEAKARARAKDKPWAAGRRRARGGDAVYFAMRFIMQYQINEKSLRHLAAIIGCGMACWAGETRVGGQRDGTPLRLQDEPLGVILNNRTEATEDP